MTTKFYYWWRYSEHPLANLFRKYNKFRLKANRAKATNFQFIESTFLFVAIHLYCLITLPWYSYQIKQQDKQNQKLQITKEMMDKKIQDLNKFYGKK